MRESLSQRLFRDRIPLVGIHGDQFSMLQCSESEAGPEASLEQKVGWVPNRQPLKLFGNRWERPRHRTLEYKRPVAGCDHGRATYIGSNDDVGGAHDLEHHAPDASS